VSVRDTAEGTGGSLGLHSLRAGVLPRVRRSDCAQRRMRYVHGVRERGVRVSSARDARGLKPLVRGVDGVDSMDGVDQEGSTGNER
jgi:hypothetical protein